MFSKIRSLIFKLDPETAHDLAIKALKFNPIPQDKIKNNNLIQTEIFGKVVPNPIGIAAGFDKDAEVYNPLFKLGFGFVEVGTVTPVNQYGNPKPRIFRLEEDMALINRLGFNNSGSEKVRSRIISNSPKGLFGINIGPNKDTNNRLEDYLICFRKFYNLADYLTINISSPNTENLRKLHENNYLEKLLYQLKYKQNSLNKFYKSSKPLFFKISPDLEDSQLEEIAKALNKFEIEGVIVSNTTESRPNLFDNKKSEKGGLSGNPLKSISLNVLKKFKNYLNSNVTIIGSGGIISADDAEEKLNNGANLVQIYSGIIYSGPQLIKEIHKKINKKLV